MPKSVGFTDINCNISDIRGDIVKKVISDIFDTTLQPIPPAVRHARNRGTIIARTYRLDEYTIHIIQTYAKTMRTSYSQAVQDMIQGFVAATKEGKVQW